MYNIFKDIILSKNYKLEEILMKIDEMYVKGSLSKIEQDELYSLARENAQAEHSYAPLQEQINQVNERLDTLENRVSILEGTEPVETEEYPEFKEPTGAHDAYNIGDKITYKGKKYVCKMDGCVWSPDTYPSAWEEVIEESEVDE